MSGTLYLVGTPIGNLSDVSPRAREILSSVSLIAAEDTRVTGKLLSLLGIENQLFSYHEHNKKEKGEKLLSRLLDGEDIALVSDAGMPAISDPGEDLVALCKDHDVPVSVVPGPCALISALAISGLPTARFSFEGFLSTAKNARAEHLASLKEDERTLIFYEAPHKLVRTLQDLYEKLGDRRISLVRELTKLHEEVIRTTLSQAVLLYNEEKKPRGEYVLVLEGAAPKAPCSEEEGLELALALRKEGMSLMSAAKEAAGRTGGSKNRIYKQLLDLEED